MLATIHDPANRPLHFPNRVGRELVCISGWGQRMECHPPLQQHRSPLVIVPVIAGYLP